MDEWVSPNALEEHLPHEFHIPEQRIQLDKESYQELKDILDTSKDERPIQRYLQYNPRILASLVSGHRGHWVVPQKCLGCHYVADFVVGAQDSAGLHWYAIELESPTAKMFRADGCMSAKLNHGIEQILDWREWLADNKSMANRRTSKNGLGLFGIRPSVPGMVFIGRRQQLDDKEQSKRRQLYEDRHILVHSYDYLLDQIETESGLWIDNRRVNKNPGKEYNRKPPASVETRGLLFLPRLKRRQDNRTSR